MHANARMQWAMGNGVGWYVWGNSLLQEHKLGSHAHAGSKEIESDQTRRRQRSCLVFATRQLLTL